MKRVLWGIALFFSLVSCDFEEEVQEALINSIRINQNVEELFTIPVIEELGEQEPIVIPIDTEELLDEINESETATLESAFLGDTVISIPEGSDATFDFLDSLSIVISSGPFAGVMLARISNIPEGATELTLTLAEDAPDIADIIESGDFDLEINYSVNDYLDEPLVLELIANLLVDLGLSIR